MNRRFASLAVLGILALGAVTPAYAQSAWDRFYNRVGVGTGTTVESVWVQDDTTGDISFGGGATVKRLDVKGAPTNELSGTVRVGDANNKIVVESGIDFTTAFNVGDAIGVEDQIFTVDSITDANNLVLDSAYQISGGVSSGLKVYSEPNLLSVESASDTPYLTVNKSGDANVAGTVTAEGFVGDGSGITNVNWANVTSFPTACSSGKYVTGIGTTLTCASIAGVSGGTVTSITAGTGLATNDGNPITNSGTLAVDFSAFGPFAQLNPNCSNNQVLKFDGTSWGCGTDLVGSGGSSPWAVNGNNLSYSVANVSIGSDLVVSGEGTFVGGLKNTLLSQDSWGDSNTFVDYLNDPLVRADKKWTVTVEYDSDNDGTADAILPDTNGTVDCPGGTKDGSIPINGGTIGNMFNGLAESSCNFGASNLPVAVTIDFGTYKKNYWRGFGAKFAWGRYASDITIKTLGPGSDSTCGNGNDDTTWTPIASATDFAGSQFFVPVTAQNVCKLRYSFDVSVNTSFPDDFRIGEIFAYRDADGTGKYVRATGDKIYGPLVIEGAFTAQKIGTSEFDVDFPYVGDNVLHLGDNAGQDFSVDVASGQGLVNLVAGAKVKINADGTPSNEYEYTGSRGASRIFMNDGKLSLYAGSLQAGTDGDTVEWRKGLTVDRFGNVGIGGNSGSGKLYVNSVMPWVEDSDTFTASNTSITGLPTDHGVTVGDKIQYYDKFGGITSLTTDDPSVITSANHGLTLQTTVNVAIEGCDTTPSINGSRSIDVLNANTFQLNGFDFSSGTSTDLSNCRWYWGLKTLQVTEVSGAGLTLATNGTATVAPDKYRVIKKTYLGNGNVGIGTTTPMALLEVGRTGGGAWGNPALAITNSGGGDNSAIKFTTGTTTQTDAQDWEIGIIRSSSTDDGIWFKDIKNDLVPLIIKDNGNLKLDGQIEQEDWNNVTYENGWASYNNDDDNNWGRAQYFKDTNGIVHLRGLIAHTSALSTQKVAFTLPTGYRPAKHYMYGLFGSDGTVCRADMRTNGEFVIYKECTGKGWVSIAGFTFRAEK